MRLGVLVRSMPRAFLRSRESGAPGRARSFQHHHTSSDGFSGQTLRPRRIASCYLPIEEENTSQISIMLNWPEYWRDLQKGK